MPVALAGPRTRRENQEIDAELRQTRGVAEFSARARGKVDQMATDKAFRRLPRSFLYRYVFAPSQPPSFFLAQLEDSPARSAPGGAFASVSASSFVSLRSTYVQLSSRFIKLNRGN